MKLTPQDIARLYGKKLYIIPSSAPSTHEKQAPVPNEPAMTEVELPKEQVQAVESQTEVEKSKAKNYNHLFEGGAPITWKMRSTSKIALILKADEFANRELTGMLKGLITEAEIPLQMAGFGVCEGEVESLDLSQMPVTLAVLFGTFPLELHKQVPTSLAIPQGDIFWCPSLSFLSQNDKAKQFSLNQLKKSKFLL